MTDLAVLKGNDIDVIIIGGGPSGLSLATELKRLGIGRVVVLEREAQAGGIPRHCGHPPFGMREFKRILTGPVYARRLVQSAQAAGVEIHTAVNVVDAREGGELLITSDRGGAQKLCARRVVFATGVRETPRSARLISGSRPLGVLNTGALQSMIYLKGRKPFDRPVVLGTELVSFSALMTCRHAKIRPQAMIEPGSHTTARWPLGLLPKVIGVPLFQNTKLVKIQGQGRVSGVLVATAKGTRQIACDGVILSGEFTPEATLARCGPLAFDAATNGPVVDQFGRCSDPAYFACGNVLHPVETAGWCWNEGRQIGRHLAQDLTKGLPPSDRNTTVRVTGSSLKFVTPQSISAAPGQDYFQLRVTGDTKGMLVAYDGDRVLWKKPVTCRKEHRILVPIDAISKHRGVDDVTLTIET